MNNKEAYNLFQTNLEINKEIRVVLKKLRFAPKTFNKLNELIKEQENQLIESMKHIKH